MLQKLSPQQIQMIKLLELPALQLEQRINQEIEENPVLEEEESADEEQEAKEVSVEEYFAENDRSISPKAFRFTKASSSNSDSRTSANTTRPWPNT